jgi:hypothetical protein
MQISVKHINLYTSKKIEAVIRNSKCFFLVQLYNLTPTEIDSLKQKASSLSLRLLRFPRTNWRKISITSLQTANHLPVQISNYALVGENKLQPEALATLSSIIQQGWIIFLFGYQENTWLNITRLLESDNQIPDSFETLLTTLQFPFDALTFFLTPSKP